MDTLIRSFTQILPAIAVTAGFVVGLTFPDIDLAPPLPLKHRSIWTHGPLIPILLVVLAGISHWWYWAAVGFLPAYAWHLTMDCFPKSWRGSALVNLYPINGVLNAPSSVIVMLAGAVASIGLWVPATIYALGTL